MILIFIFTSDTLYPSFWVGTNAGTVFIYILTSDKSTSTGWQLAKEVQLKHKAPIVFIRLVDSTGAPVSEATGLPLPSAAHTRDHHNPHHPISTRVLICSEEQFKLFTLPNFKPLHKFKLTAHEGARVRRLEVATFASKAHEGSVEHALECLTNLGDVSIFSLADFKRKYQSHFLKKEDINGITSLLLTKYGEGFYLKSSSEYQRFTLSSKRTNFPECFIVLPEPEVEVVEELDEEVEASPQKQEAKSSETEEDKPKTAETALNTTITSITTTSASEASSTTFISHNHSSSFNNTVESVIDHLW